MSTNERVACLAGLGDQALDILVPRHHRLVRLGTEHPGMTPVHRPRLPSLEHELVRIRIRL